MNTATVSAFAAAFAALAAAATLGWNACQCNQTARAQQHERLIQQRREALFAALQSIDHVFANEPLVDGRPPNPYE